MQARSIGNLGEKEAEKYLKKCGYKILEKKYTSKCGEIDIIAKDGEYLCFVEVRMRKNSDFGTPGETVTRQKQTKIINTAKDYISKHNLDGYFRFDVVSILGEEKGNKLNIKNMELIKNAF